MEGQNRFFINVEDALNFIELHDSFDELHQYEVTKEGAVEKKQGLKKLWAKILNDLGIDKAKQVKLAILKNSIAHLRTDFQEVKNEKIHQAIINLEQLAIVADIDPLISELRRFRVALRADADLKLKRLSIMAEAAQTRVESLKTLDQRSIPSHILDALTEIEETLEAFNQERDLLEKGHKVYSSIIQQSQAIDKSIEPVREAYTNIIPSALNWALLLSLEEMTEQGIPSLPEVVQGLVFEISPENVERSEKKYQQLRKLYLKYHKQLRTDLKGAFDNNFAEYEARLYYARQNINQPNEGL